MLGPPSNELRKLRRTSRFRDRAGERWGRLTIITWAGYRRENGINRSYWDCRCACGNRVISRATGNIRSCGCAAAERRKACEQFTKIHNGRRIHIRTRMINCPDGVKRTTEEAAAAYGLTTVAIKGRIDRGWPEREWLRPPRRFLRKRKARIKMLLADGRSFNVKEVK